MTVETGFETGAPETNPQTAPEATPSWAMLRTLGGISLISGLLVVLAYQFTLPIIAENQRLRTERAVFQVLPGAVSKRDFLVRDGGLVAAGEGGGGAPVYAAYDGDGRLLGAAFIGTGSGYGGPVRVLFAYDPQRQIIMGSKVLQSTETPGFGDKLDTDPDLLASVRRLDVRLNAEGTALANPIRTVKHSTATNPWEIDGISGATLSSKAMGQAANAAAHQAVPAIVRDLATLTAPH